MSGKTAAGLALMVAGVAAIVWAIRLPDPVPEAVDTFLHGKRGPLAAGAGSILAVIGFVLVALNEYGRWLTAILRIALGGVFMYAAWVKLFQFSDGRLHLIPWQLFAMAIDSYQLLPQAAVEFTAKTLPWLELAVGLLLVIGVWVRWASIVTSGLLVVFFTLIVRAYAKGQEISCGCFGPGEIISWKTLLRDGSMVAASLWITAVSWLSRRSPVRSPESRLPSGTPPEPAPNLPPSVSPPRP